MHVEQTIREKLTQAFFPQRLEIVNESHLHASHAASPGTGVSHFRVEIESDAFDGVSRIERHRMVNEALAVELAGPVHALSIKAMTAAESRGRS